MITRKGTDTIMASPRPRSNKQHGRSRGRKPSNRADRQRARQDSPRSLLVLAILVTLVALAGDSITAAFFLGPHPPGSRIHMDLGVPVMGIACTIVAVMAWRAWWKLWRAKLVSHRPKSNSAAKKESI